MSISEKCVELTNTKILIQEFEINLLQKRRAKFEDILMNLHLKLKEIEKKINEKLDPPVFNRFPIRPQRRNEQCRFGIKCAYKDTRCLFNH